MSYYDRKWQPWRTRGKATSIASMAVWERPKRWNDRAERDATTRCSESGGLSSPFPASEWRAFLRRPRVLLDVDMWDISSRIMPDKSRIVWSVIDSTPSLTWLAFTRHPHLIAQHWPQYQTYHVDSVGRPLPLDHRRKNVCLGVDVSTQAEADELIPALLKGRELCGNLIVRVTVTERIALPRGWRWAMDSFTDEAHKPRVDWLILQGDIGRKAKPCNVAHVRELVTQARESGVPCWVERLGSHAVESRTLITADWHLLGEMLPAWDRRTGKPLRDTHGADPSEWPEDLRNAREVPT